MGEMMEPIKKLRGEHSLTIFVSFELKTRLSELAKKYDRTVSDMLRAIIKVGIPVMEGISESEEILVKEYLELFRKMRLVHRLKD